MNILSIEELYSLFVVLSCIRWLMGSFLSVTIMWPEWNWERD